MLEPDGRQRRHQQCSRFRQGLDHRGRPALQNLPELGPGRGLFTDALKAAGFKADVQYAGASTTVKDQQDQISTMVTEGAKVIIMGAADGGQLGTQVKAAHDAGATVIAYDRLILNTADVDNYVAYDSFKVGQLQGQALLDGLKAKKAAGPYNIELFSGSSDDANSKVFFDGAMSMLKPKIANGTLVVGSGQVDIKQTATAAWKAENAQSHMDALLTSTCGSKSLDGVLSPNDTLARAIITSVKSAGKPIPVVTVRTPKPSRSSRSWLASSTPRLTRTPACS
jgi:putative multiple sugar transport system substrate-binding protein